MKKSRLKDFSNQVYQILYYSCFQTESASGYLDKNAREYLDKNAKRITKAFALISSF